MKNYFILFALLSSSLFGEPSIRVSKLSALIDKEIVIEVKGLKPLEQVVLRTETLDSAGRLWSAEAVYLSDERGRVRLAKNAPIDGSYSGVDSMGLFWSMQLESGEHLPYQPPQEMVVDLCVIVGRQTVASRAIKRLRKSPEIRSFSADAHGIVGTLFYPPSKQPLPALITVGGVEGEVNETRAQLLASHGFAVLALSYFGAEGLPPTLEKVPLEYFDKVLKWIKTQPDIDSSRIGLLGFSRGAEVALLLGTLFPHEIRAIGAISPSSVLFGSQHHPNEPAWTLNQKPVGAIIPLPTIPSTTSLGTDPNHPMRITPLVLKAINDREQFERAAIPVEKLKAALLLVSGGEDQIWPSSLFAEQIKERLKRYNSPIKCKHYHYPKAGHQIGTPFVPTDPLFYYRANNLWLATGGSAQEDDRASRDAWQKILVFFQNQLDSISK